MDWIREHVKTFFAANQPDRILLAIGAYDIGGATVPQLKERMDKLVNEIYTLQPNVSGSLKMAQAFYAALTPPPARDAIATHRGKPGPEKR
jgi:hypothetical protein